jgi:putative aldouronate transport system substrate-binding protein
MKKIGRVVCTVLAGSLLTASLAACGKSENEGSDDKWRAANGVTVDWFINMSYWKSSPDLWDTAEVLKEVVEKTGVKPNVTIPTGSGLEKINLMMATGDMPDMMTFESGDPQLDQMVKNNAIYPLEELIDKYCPEMKSEIPDSVWTYSAQPVDGVLYGLPSWFKSDRQIEEKEDLNTCAFLVRSDIYEELGEPDMSTPEGFYNALVQFKEKYPEINGRKTIPLCLYPEFWSAPYLQRAFGIRSCYIDENDNYFADWKDPKYEEFIKYMVKLNQAGLTDPEAFVKKQDQVEEDLSQGLSFAVLWKFDGLTSVNKALKNSYPNARYKVIEPMNAYGQKTILSDVQRKGWTITVIPRGSKHPEECLKFMRYMWSHEGNLLMDYGKEGRDWVRIDENTIQMTDDYATRSKEENFMNETGIYSYRLFHYQYDKVLPAPNVEQSIEDIEDRPFANEFAATDLMYLTLMRSIDPNSEEGLIETQAKQVVQKARAKFLTAKDENTAISEYRKMIDDVYALGYDKVDKLKSEYHKEAKLRVNKSDSEK